MHFFVLTAADSEIVVAAALYRPGKLKKLQGQRFKDELRRGPNAFDARAQKGRAAENFKKAMG